MQTPPPASAKPSADRPVRGRPVDAAKSGAILDAARAVFVAQGLAGLTIEGVAAAATVSKVTIYRQFTDRSGLMSALVERETRWMEAAIDAISPGDAGTLQDWATAQMTFLTRADVRAFDAQITAAADMAPDLVRAVFAAGPARLHQALARHLADEMAGARLARGSPDRAAALLMAMLWSTEPVSELRGLAPAPDPSERQARSARAIQRFHLVWPGEAAI
jgi:TetR/AcrR family transcriptional regulator, mexJK operon transcriptional repressor